MISQAERVYNYLLICGSITNSKARDEFGFCHLPSIIRDIKKQYQVQFTEEWETGNNRYGEKIRWKKYILKTPDKANNYWEGA